MRRMICLIWVLMLLGCTACPAAAEEWGDFVVEEDEVTLPPDYHRQAQVLMRRMTDEEKIYQLFFVAPEDLTGEKRTDTWPESNVLAAHPVGGVVLFGQNIVSEDQLRQFTSALQVQAKQAKMYPLLVAVHEQGGAVSRVANKLGYPLLASQQEIGQTGDASMAYDTGLQIAAYLAALGINTDFAPAADVITVEDSQASGRSYGNDPEAVSRMAVQMSRGLRAGGVISCVGQFPGLGGAPKRNNSGVSSMRRTLADMRAAEWIPFRDAIADGADMIMVSHVLVRAVGDDMPASTSPRVVNGLLRGELGFEGVVITEALRMSAITGAYKPGQECVAALQAGADLLLLPKDFQAGVRAVRQALSTGEITMERIDESVERILALKIRYGLIR